MSFTPLSFIENETLILESENRQVMLTTHRVFYHDIPSSDNQSDFNAIDLDEITSIELIQNKNSNLLLTVGIVTAPLVLGILLIITYLNSQRRMVSIRINNGKSIVFEAKGIKQPFLKKFIKEVRKQLPENEKII